MAFVVEYSSPQSPNTYIVGTQRDSCLPYTDNTAVRVGIANTGDICHLIIEQLEDGGSSWKETARVPVAGDGAYRSFDFPISLRYYRISLQTGSSQSALFVSSALIEGDGYDNPKVLTYNISSGAVSANANSTQKTLNLGTEHGFSKIRSLVSFDQACTLVVEQSSDGVTWRRTDSFTLTPATAGVAQAVSQESNIVAQYVRAYVINGATAQGASNFQHILSLISN